MDTFRYGLAVVLVCVFPPLLLGWPVIHGLIGVWRRVGLRVTYLLVLAAAALGALGLFQARAHLLSVEFGTNWLLITSGVLCLGVAGRMRVALHRDITNKALSGVPELDPSEVFQPLVRTGLYARIRHPRYVQLWLALLAYALVANYLTVYIFWLLWMPAIYAITILEERELRRRLGQEHEAYCREVPRFLPGRRR